MSDVFLISRAGQDRVFAAKINEILQAAGYKTILQDDDFGYRDFMDAMHEALSSDARVIALYSPDYFASQHCRAEAQGALTGDIFNAKQRLIPLRIAECDAPGIFANIAYADLLPVRAQGNDELLRDIVLALIKPGARQIKTGPTAPLWMEPKTVLHKLIGPLNNFTGRERDMQQLREMLFAGGRAAVTQAQETKTAAVAGLGGIGKSMLAREYGWRHRDDYAGVWWLRAQTKETLLADIVALGTDGLHLAGILDEPELDRAASFVLEHLANGGFAKPWLLIYDNVERPEQIDHMTPRHGAHILITSRWSDFYGEAEALQLGLFTREESIAFLLAGTGRTDSQGADRLAGELGDLPLALEQAAAYVRSARHVSFDDYIQRKTALLQKTPRSGPSKMRENVWVTFTLALERVIEGDEQTGFAPCPEAETLMGILAFLAPDNIPLELISTDIMSDIEKGEAVAALSEISLISWSDSGQDTSNINVHRLVQDVMKERLGEERESEFAAVAVKLVAQLFPNPASDVRNWPLCALLYPHANTVLATAPDEGETAQMTTLLLNQLAVYLQARADFTEAEPLMRRALTIDEKSFGPDHPNVAIHLNNLAQLLQDTNRLEEVEPLMRRALLIDETSFGPDHPNVAIRLNNLAQLLKATNRLEEAEPLMRRALAIDEKSFGPDHPNVAIDLNNLAQLLKATNRLDEAEPLMRRALAIDEKSFGPDHPNVAIRLNNLAQLLKATNRLEEAEPLMRRALAIDEKSFGPDHPNVAIHLNNLASLLQATNRLDEAEPLMRRALAIDENSFGPNHPKVAIRLNNLAQLLQATNRLDEAEPLMRRALAIDENSFGPDHPNVAIRLNNLALLLKATNRLAEAEPLMRRALAIDENSFGPDHPNVAIRLNNLASLLQDTNRLDEAEPLAARTCEIFETSLGSDHPNTIIVRNNLAALRKELTTHTNVIPAKAGNHNPGPTDGSESSGSMNPRLRGDDKGKGENNNGGDDATDNNDKWYMARGDKRYGPLTTAKLRAMIKDGKFARDDLVWRQGLTGWVKPRNINWT